MLPQFPRIQAHSVEPEFPISTSFVMFAQGYVSNTISIILSYSRLNGFPGLFTLDCNQGQKIPPEANYSVYGEFLGEKLLSGTIPNPKIPSAIRLVIFFCPHLLSQLNSGFRRSLVAAENCFLGNIPSRYGVIMTCRSNWTLGWKKGFPT